MISKIDNRRPDKTLNAELNKTLNKYKKVLEAKGIIVDYNNLLELDNLLFACHIDFDNLRFDNCNSFNDVMDYVRTVAV